MRKLTLNFDALNVETFETAKGAAGQGTVYGNAQTNGQNTQCLSAIDACPTGFCAPTYDEYQCTALCPESYNDACPSSRGCTTISPC